ncbi:hypothetical protein PIB30_059222 [Stylosanthes scabra]|uniref:Uncharacterized protein n=1 Tax=Stylosanthes scabra TaxID=79078 RepID=A0ABU6RKJ5_9FABA|nr:hypothetical protein [Stylosanthes scabra]
MALFDHVLATSSLAQWRILSAVVVAFTPERSPLGFGVDVKEKVKEHFKEYGNVYHCHNGVYCCCNNATCATSIAAHLRSLVRMVQKK